MLPIHLAGESCSKMWIRAYFSMCLVQEYTVEQQDFTHALYKSIVKQQIVTGYTFCACHRKRLL